MIAETGRSQNRTCASIRSAMQRALLSLAAILLAFGLLTPGGPVAFGQTAPRPHILYIVADDLGYADVGFHGSDIQTPNLDRLAASGVELSQFYVQPMCTPTRAALMTGRYPFRYGLQTAVIPAGGAYGLATDEIVLPQVLQSAGYATSIVGKWHIGHSVPEMMPRQRGFDRAFGPLIGEIDHFSHESHGATDWFRENELVVEEGYDTTLFGDEAVRQIEAHDPDQPLFMYLAFTAPHTPYQAPQEYLDLYPGITDQLRQAYAGQITAMDYEIGRVVEALAARGMLDNTLIIFHSDNGGTRNAAFAGETEVKGELPPSNGDLREGKGTNYEGGTRVVSLFNWPGMLTPGKSNALIHVTDMLPTLAGLAGADATAGKPLDGMDVWASIAGGAPSPRTEIVYNVEPFRAAVREGDWKLVWVPTLPPRIELFDLAADPGETANLAGQNPELVATLQARIEALAAEAVPPLFLMDMVRIGLTVGPTFPSGEISFAEQD